MLEEVFSGDYSGITKYNFMAKHLCLLGKEGKVLGYRIRCHPSYVSELASSTLHLHPVPPDQKNRGEFDERHYVVWANYPLRSVLLSSVEFRRDNHKEETASWCIESNRDLLKAVNNAHICIVPGE
jgi:hypothetical protein